MSELIRQENISGMIRLHWITLRSAVKMEKLGMERSKRPSARTIAIKELQLPYKSSYDDVIAAISKKLGEELAAKQP